MEATDISNYRRKLDKTLASPDLMNDEKLRTLVRNQILQSSDDLLHFEGEIENVVAIRSKQVSNVLSMLRTADSPAAWKVKQETDEFRVMYRQGAEGSPFHTLLVEGYVDGPLDVCVCISWETGLYNKWWPQTSIPAFKIISSRCLKRVRPGEQISLVRMKVSWPLSSREALLHYFAFEYLQHDLILVLINSISDSESIDRCSHGFTREGIPNAEDLVRVEVVGGFVCQKVTANRCYFRAIASVDVKLDMIPPSFINFISRQLLATGFNLFKKEVASINCGAGDDSFGEALKDPFYARIREGLSSTDDLKRSASITVEDALVDEDDELKGDEHEAIEHGSSLKSPSSDCGMKKAAVTSPEVEEALQILEKANSIIQQFRINSLNEEEESITSEGDEEEEEEDTKCRVDEPKIINHASSSRVKDTVSETKLQDKIGAMNQKKMSKRKSHVRRLKSIKSRFCCWGIISS